MYMHTTHKHNTITFWNFNLCNGFADNISGKISFFSYFKLQINKFPILHFSYYVMSIYFIQFYF